MTTAASVLRNQFGTDKEKETKGVVIQFGDLVVRLARAGKANKAYVTDMEETFRPYQRMIAVDVMSEVLAERLLKDVFARTVVLEAYILGEDEAKAVTRTPMTSDEIRSAMDDPEYGSEFWNFVQTESGKLANYRLVAREAVAKN